MKKIISLVCIIALLCTMVLPMLSLTVSATDYPSSKWTLKNGAVDENGVIHLKATQSGTGPQAVLSHTFSKDIYTIQFSLKINSSNGNMGLQGGNGVHRWGFYINGSSFSPMGGTGSFDKLNSFDGGWHDFVMEIDHVKGTQTVYIDEVLAGTIQMQNTYANRYSVTWFCNAMGGDIEISDFAIIEESAVDDSLLKITPEYTEAFRQEWNEIGGWMVEGSNHVTHYPEEGIIRLRVGGEQHTYRSIERPLRPTRNYDMEWRIKLPEPSTADEQQGQTHLELSTDNRHTWMRIGPDTVNINNYGMDADVPLYEGHTTGFPFTIGHDWHTWKAEVRDMQVTWYVDGKELVSYQMLERNTNRWHVAVFQQNYATLTADVLVDWIEYTPYFEEELTMHSPVNGSIFHEGKPIDIKAETSSAVEKIDYYVNDVYVGSGYPENGYTYTLSGAKAGNYTVFAKCGEEETVKWGFTVKKVMETVLSLDKTEVNAGETAKATVNVKSSTNEAISKVEFYFDGQLHSTDTSAPFETTVSSNQVGTAAVYAKAYSVGGSIGESDKKQLNVKFVSGKQLDIGQEYSLDYTLNSSNGNISLNDGFFKLAISHNGDKITYITRDGEELYENIGAGEYKVVVTSGYAELYYNGQYLESFFMPYDTAADNFTNSGLENVVLKGSDVKAEVYYKKWNGESNFEDKTVPTVNWYSLEFDKTDASPETLIFDDGIFENEIFFREDGIYVKNQLDYHFEPEELKLSSSVEPGYYRLTVGYGISQLFVNNKLVGSYRCNLSAKMPVLKRTMTNPSASTFISIKNTDDVYYFDEDFEGNTEIAATEYWIDHYEDFANASVHDLTETIKEANGNHYMNLSGNGVYLLNTVDNYPSFKWRSMVEKREGSVSFVIRHGFADLNNRFVYNFGTNTWNFENQLKNGTIVDKQSKYDPNAFKAGQWYNFEIVCDGFNVILLCDGKEAFRAEIENGFEQISYGRVGIGVEEAEINFDDVYYQGCGKPGAGFNYLQSASIKEASPLANWPSTFYEMDGAVYATCGNGTMKSTDNGITWTDATTSTDSGQIFTSDIVTMPDGSLVKITGLASQKSTDGGKTWVSGSDMWHKGNAGSVQRLNCTMSGRLFYTVGEGTEWYGHTNIFYSDDGLNWTKSETTITTANTGVVMNECIVMDTPRENEVWMYARTGTGYLCYWISYDNGVTFDLTPHYSPLMQSAVCYCIQRDWENPDTYYAFFNEDSTLVMQEQINSPRSRPTLVVSYDGMQTWQHITTVMESCDWPLSRNSDLALRLIDNHIYYRTAEANRGGVIFGSQDLSVAKIAKRMPGLHYRKLIGYDMAWQMEKYSVLPKTDGMAYVYGEYPDVKVADGRADVTTAAKVFGVTAETSGGTVVLRLGEGKVTFTEGSASYDVNGETRTADRAVLSGGYLDIKTLADIYGKHFKETENSFLIMQTADLVDRYQNMIETFM